MEMSQAMEHARQHLRGDALLEGLAERVGLSFQARAVFGEPVERPGVTVIPVAKSRWGFGGGTGGEGESQGSGGGGGGFVSPVGYIEVRDGEAEFMRLRDPTRSAAWGAALLMLAGLLGRRLSR
jgi:uncharacterized spore protein YtfJ